MSDHFSKTAFYKELELLLNVSSCEQRKMWASQIIDKNIDIKYLSNLLKCEQKVALRFLWLLSDIGISNPKKLFIELPYLLELLEKHSLNFKTSLASYWLIAGVPIEDEGRAIDLLFQWLNSNETNVTIKSRSCLVLLNITKKYPDLKNELKLCLINQIDNHSTDFRKRVSKLLIELEA